MRLSDLIKELLNRSEFTSINSLAEYTGQTQPFTDAFVNSTKAAREKEDLIFDALTNDISVEELLHAIDLIKSIRAKEIEREQII